MWSIKIVLGAKRKPQSYHVPFVQLMISRADKSRHKSAVKRAEAARLMARWCCFVFVFVCCVLIVDWGSFVFDRVMFNHILNDVKVKWRVDKLEDAHGQFQWWLTWHLRMYIIKDESQLDQRGGWDGCHPRDCRPPAKGASIELTPMYYLWIIETSNKQKAHFGIVFWTCKNML